jgi:hypothetical protein
MGILPLPDSKPRITVSTGAMDSVKAFYCTDEVDCIIVG